MKPRFLVLAHCLFFLGWLLAAGCSQKVTAPEPLALDQVSSSLATAFQGAKVELQTLASAAAGAVDTQRYDQALLALQSLSTQSGLSPEQRDIAARAMLTVNQELAAQATTGNQAAQQTLQQRRMDK
ncbi:MAG: hypothetical protein FJ387_18985 [Verrucomicrobia bacterium]|nr:hypothetical protein [Verrucomicrobiota bacterium]